MTLYRQDFATGVPSPRAESVHNTRCGSYSERTSIDGTGTVLDTADLCHSVDTIRPVNRVDPIGSLQLSAEFIGNPREKLDTSPISSKGNESAKAGVSIIDQVILPVIQKVL